MMGTLKRIDVSGLPPTLQSIKAVATELIIDLGNSRPEDRKFFDGKCFNHDLRRSGALKRSHLKVHSEEGVEGCFAVHFCLIGKKNNGAEFYQILGAEMIPKSDVLQDLQHFMIRTLNSWSTQRQVHDYIDTDDEILVGEGAKTVAYTTIVGAVDTEGVMWFWDEIIGT
tara:strand:- start:610 stop:1116 length:507 start_codon:yes stop_codon:yes gene_type:complete